MVRSLVIALAAAVLLLAGEARGQAPSAGALLIAAPELEDRNFARSVLLLVHADSDGTLGVLINRPTNVPPARLLPGIASLEHYGDPVFLGGPLAPQQVLILLRAPLPAGADARAVASDIYLSADLDMLARLSAPELQLSQLRLYAGHAAWAPGQLEAEIASGDWQIAPGRAEHVFTPAPLDLWQRLVRSRGELVVEARVNPRRGRAAAD